MKYDSRNMLDLFQSVIFIRGECRADMCLWRVRPRQMLVCDDSERFQLFVCALGNVIRSRQMNDLRV